MTDTNNEESNKNRDERVRQEMSLVQRRRSELALRFSDTVTISNKPAVVLEDGIVTDRTEELKRRFSMKDAVKNVVNVNRLKQLHASVSLPLPNDLTSQSEHASNRVRAALKTKMLSSTVHSSRSSLPPTLPLASRREPTESESAPNQTNEHVGEQEAPQVTPLATMYSTSNNNDDDDDGRFEGLDRYMALMSKTESEKFQQVMKPPPRLSFVDTYVAIGGGIDCRKTGRGSIFVMADAKLAKTRVVQRRLEKAGKIIQRFFRYAKHILKFHSQEIQYWREALADAKRRHKGELKDVRVYIELEKHRVAIEVEEELGRLEDELAEKQKIIAEHRRELDAVKSERHDMYDAIRQLTLDNIQLAEQTENPMAADELKDLEEHVGFLKFRNVTYQAMFDECQTVNEEYDQRLLMATTQAQLECTIKEITENCVNAIIQLVAAGCDDDKLVKKIQKKRDKLAQKIADRAAEEAEEAAKKQLEQAEKDKLRDDRLQKLEVERLQQEENSKAQEEAKSQRTSTRRKHVVSSKEQGLNLRSDPSIVPDEKQAKGKSNQETPDVGSKAAVSFHDSNNNNNNDSGTDDSPRSGEDELNLSMKDRSMKDRSSRRRERRERKQSMKDASMKDESMQLHETEQGMNDASMKDDSMKDESTRRRERKKSMKDSSMKDESMKDRSKRRSTRLRDPKQSMEDDSMKDDNAATSNSSNPSFGPPLEGDSSHGDKKKKKDRNASLKSSPGLSSKSGANNDSFSVSSLLESESAHGEKKKGERTGSMKSPKKNTSRRATLQPGPGSSTLFSLIQGDVIPPEKSADTSFGESSTWSMVIGNPGEKEKKIKKNRRASTTEIDSSISMAFFSLVDSAVETSRNRRADKEGAEAAQAGKPPKPAKSSKWSTVKSQKATLAAMGKMGASSPLLDLIAGSTHGGGSSGETSKSSKTSRE